MMLKELASYLKAELVPGSGDLAVAGDTPITGVSPIQKATPSDVTFLSRGDYHKYLAKTKAAAVIVAEPMEGCPCHQLVHDNPYYAFAKTARLFYRGRRGPTGISDQAFIAADATVAESAVVYPNVFIGPKVQVGEEVVLYPGVYIGEGCKIGDHTILYANVVVEHDVVIDQNVIIHAGAVIGTDGFGFATGDEGIVKIPQVGSVQIGSDVEIGAGTTIDRGTMTDTIIGRGTKIDSRVHVGHNAIIGEECLICAMNAISSSAKIGDRSTLSGFCGVNNGVEIEPDSFLQAFTAVTKSPGTSGYFAGFPAKPSQIWRRQVAHIGRLERYAKRIKGLESKLEALGRQIAGVIGKPS